MTNIEVLKERVGWGEEFLFRYKNNEYWISQNEFGIYLTKVDTKGNLTQNFSTADDLFRDGRVNGEKIDDIWEEIKKEF
ncbi:MAG: hypothetical protein LBI13_02650 [Streptococcaceae bacterium]|nr:hypothetical protein [Streptococcaceae bacterium]